MNLADRLKATIKENGKFDADKVAVYVRDFFTMNPSDVITISFYDHYDWIKKGNPFNINSCSRPHGSSVTMPSSWSMDLRQFLITEGFYVKEDRSWNTNELHYLRVSLV